MKKRFWVCVAFLPFLLTITLSWAPTQASERKEKEFRKQLLAEASGSANTWFTVSIQIKNRIVDLGDWTPAQLKAALADVHLQKASRAVPDASTILRFEAFAGEIDPISGFYVFPGGKAGVIGGARTSPLFNEKWSGFGITPKSSRALERRVWKLYGPKLRALRIPPPKLGN